MMALSISLGCSRSDRSGSPASSERLNEAANAPADVKAAPDGVQLVSAGRSPFLKPRWKFSPGQSQDAELSSQFSVLTKLGIQPMPETVGPQVTFELRVQTKDVSEDGTARLSFEVLGATVQPSAATEPESVAVMKRSASTLVGLKGSYAADSLGRIRDVEFTDSEARRAADPGLLDTLERLIDASLVPLPEDKIGEGAKWTYAESFQEGGATVRQVSTFEITKLTDEELHTKIIAQRHAEKQTIALPGGAPERSYELLALESNGTGRSEARLYALMPESATMSTKGTMKMLLPAVEGQTAQSMQMELKTQSSVRAK